MKHGETADLLFEQGGEHDSDLAAVSFAVRGRLSVFAVLLKRWNPTIKLVSNQDMRDLWTRHIADALQLMPLMPVEADHAVDLGSGGGFPGLILALATDVHFDLIESDGRKAAFLQEAVTATKAPATVHIGRAEDMALVPRMLVTARALAPLPKLLELARPFLADSGVCLFPKGQNADSEIAEARKHWNMDLEQIPSRTSPSGRLLRVTNVRRRKDASS